MIQVTAIHLVGGKRHEHIAEVKWQDPQSGESRQSSRAQMVEWLSNSANRAYVSDGATTVDVGVVKAKPPYIRTHADGKWTDNLLALPEY